ncbi:MAG: transcriptional repressor LexA [Clostridia bacterium]
MEKLNDTQERILEYLKERMGSGMSPTVREIGQVVGLKSTSSVQTNLDALEKKGYIVRDPLLKRSIRVVGQADNIQHVPLIGQVAAGQPILAIEQIEEYIPFSGYSSSNKGMFALRVKGESMINVGIFDKDIIFVEQTPVARNGEIVVALIEDEATVKTFYKEKGHFRLQPENDTMDPIIVDQVAILGKVVALLRNF